MKARDSGVPAVEPEAHPLGVYLLWFFIGGFCGMFWTMVCGFALETGWVGPAVIGTVCMMAGIVIGVIAQKIIHALAE
jgi:hypothetical protein